MARYVRIVGGLCSLWPGTGAGLPGQLPGQAVVQILWLAILLIFYRPVFARTSVVATWSEAQYLFFVGLVFPWRVWSKRFSWRTVASFLN